MDRFIESVEEMLNRYKWHLKSNMDRFIVSALQFYKRLAIYLKSNMDRFIDRVNA